MNKNGWLIYTPNPNLPRKWEGIREKKTERIEFNKRPKKFNTRYNELMEGSVRIKKLDTDGWECYRTKQGRKVWRSAKTKVLQYLNPKQYKFMREKTMSKKSSLNPSALSLIRGKTRPKKSSLNHSALSFYPKKLNYVLSGHAGYLSKEFFKVPANVKIIFYIKKNHKLNISKSIQTYICNNPNKKSYNDDAVRCDPSHVTRHDIYTNQIINDYIIMGDHRISTTHDFLTRNLSIKSGDILYIISQKPDGWRPSWAKRAGLGRWTYIQQIKSGDRGYIPTRYLTSKPEFYSGLVSCDTNRGVLYSIDTLGQIRLSKLVKLVQKLGKPKEKYIIHALVCRSKYN